MNRRQPPFDARASHSLDEIQLQALAQRTERARTLAAQALCQSRDAATGSVEAGYRATGAHLRAAHRMAARVTLVDQNTTAPLTGRVHSVSPLIPGHLPAPTRSSEGGSGIEVGSDIDQAA